MSNIIVDAEEDEATLTNINPKIQIKKKMKRNHSRQKTNFELNEKKINNFFDEQESLNHIQLRSKRSKKNSDPIDLLILPNPNQNQNQTENEIVQTVDPPSELNKIPIKVPQRFSSPERKTPRIPGGCFLASPLSRHTTRNPRIGSHYQASIEPFTASVSALSLVGGRVGERVRPGAGSREEGSGGAEMDVARSSIDEGSIGQGREGTRSHPLNNSVAGSDSSLLQQQQQLQLQQIGQGEGQGQGQREGHVSDGDTADLRTHSRLPVAPSSSSSPSGSFSPSISYSSSSSPLPRPISNAKNDQIYSDYLDSVRLDGLVWSAYGIDTPHSTGWGEKEPTREFHQITNTRRKSEVQYSDNNIGNNTNIWRILRHEMQINEMDQRETEVQKYVSAAFQIIQNEKNVRILRNKIQNFRDYELFEKNMKERRERKSRQRERQKERERGREQDRERERERDREREEREFLSAGSLLSQTDDIYSLSSSSGKKYLHENGIENDSENVNVNDYEPEKEKESGSENENTESNSVNDSTTVKNTDLDFDAYERIPYTPSTIIIRPHALDHILETLHRW
jgi:hypothetical protein